MTDFEQKLAALKPVAVDRDAVLFAAGRASAPSRRPWVVACGLLVAGNLFLLSEQWGSPPPTEPPPALPAEPVPSPPDPSSYLALLRTWDAPPPPAGGAAADPPPLTAGSRSF